MSEDGRDLVEQLHREAAERYWEGEEKARALVERLHREKAERLREEQRQGNELVERLHREAAEQASQQPLPEPPTLHYTELPEADPSRPLFDEWNTYRRDVGRLLAEGHAGRYVLVKGERIIGLWDTQNEALAAGYRSFPGQPFLVHAIQERERVLRCVTVQLWLSSLSRCRPAN